MDYTLYPIKKTDVNWPLYYMVSHFLKLKYELDEVGGSDVGDAQLFQSIDDDAKNEKRSYEYYLVFPFDELTVSYNEAMLGQEAMILKCFFDIEHPNSQYMGDDENVTYEKVPLEYFHFVESDRKTALKHFRTDLLTHFPNCVYNGDAFLEAINRLLAFLQEKQLTELAWYSRLQTVVAMLEGNANELHILHNAGLFDNQTLWSWLEDKDIPESEIEKVKEPYLTQLHRYAMFVLNELDWRWGNPIKEEDREKRWGLFSSLTEEQQAATVEEQARRLDLMQGKMNRPQAKITMPAESTPAGPKPAEKPVNDSDDKHVPKFVTIVLVIVAVVALLFWILNM